MTAFVDGIEQPDEQDDLRFGRAFYARGLPGDGSIVGIGLGDAGGEPVGDGDAAGLGKHPSGAEIGGGVGCGGVCVIPISRG